MQKVITQLREIGGVKNVKKFGVNVLEINLFSCRIPRVSEDEDKEIEIQ